MYQLTFIPDGKTSTYELVLFTGERVADTYYNTALKPHS